MARIRTVKPEFWTSEQVTACSPAARLFFIGLWNYCDDKGHHPLAVKQLKALLFAIDEDISPASVRRFIDELKDARLLRIYSVAGRDYLEVTGWHHQKIDKPQKPKFPGPLGDNAANIPRLVATDGNTEYITENDAKGIHIENIGERSPQPTHENKEDSSSNLVAPCPKTKTAISPTFQLSDRQLEACRMEGATDEIIDRELKRFIGHHREKGWFSADWDASWFKWWAGRRPEKQVAAKATPSADLNKQLDEIDWDKACQAYARSQSNWFRGIGAEPGAPACQCPREIMEKHGIDPETGIVRRRYPPSAVAK